MALRISDTWVKLWEIQNDDNGIPMATLSTSARSKDGTYWTDFRSGYVKFRGGAADKARMLKGDERIRITSGAFQNVSFKPDADGKHKMTLGNLTIFDFDYGDEGEAPQTTSAKRTTRKASQPKEPQGLAAPDGVDEDLPFN